jgi:hypothetical protein
MSGDLTLVTFKFKFLPFLSVSLLLPFFNSEFHYLIDFLFFSREKLAAFFVF